MKKINLKQLEVKSFVTNLNENAIQTVKGGSNACVSDGTCEWSFDCSDGPQREEFSGGPI